MRRFIPFAFLALLVLTGPGRAGAQTDLTGTWEISWEGMRGTTTVTFVFQQEGDTFTGTAQMQMMGRPGGGGAGGGTREIQVTDGKVEGNDFTFSMAMGMGERSMSFAFSGTVEGTAMSGTMTNPRGESPFTGVKK